ncbi:hypothetical protein LTR28_009205, partial [Elasticomyces elasticus]
ITPVAEFNTFADSVAAARVYALTSPRPASTMPPAPPAPPPSEERSEKPSSPPPPPSLAPYPDPLSRRLDLTLFPLDITSPHTLTRGQFRRAVGPLLEQGSPLAEWTNAFLEATFRKIEAMRPGDAAAALQLHDPLCVWYAMTGCDPGWDVVCGVDVRVETSGQWTRGMCVVDRRGRARRGGGDGDGGGDGEGEPKGDSGNWLGRDAGNRMGRCVGSPGTDVFGEFLLRTVFGL